MHSRQTKNWFDVSAEELRILFRYRPNPEGWTKGFLWLVTAFLTPITLAGSLLGFARAYMRFEYPKDTPVRLYPLTPVMRVAMILGAIMIWVMLFILVRLFLAIIPDDWLTDGFIFYYLGANLLIGTSVFLMFRRWRIGINNALIEGEKFGSARFARADELEEYRQGPGFYVGGGYQFKDRGHMLTVAGTRGGKGTNLIIPNLLGVGGYTGSWVVIDPKGENAAITARYQREQNEAGRDVVVLNPWGLLAENVGNTQSYNPLDILSDPTNINLVDDAQMIAEMIVPIDKGDKDKFFTDNARTIVSGPILHLVTDVDKKERSLKKLWEWLRLPKDQWEKLVEDMSVNDHEVFGDVVKQASNEILKLSAAGDRTWGTILAVALQCTDFMKSPALQKAMVSGFDPATLSDGHTTLYVIIPADKLQSHARWLRLVVTTTMRGVVRKPNERVCFLLDEFAALGYLPEIETALSTYAGYNITVWAILQSLIQLKANYKDNWETFVGNSTIRTYFSVNDNFTADYVSKAIGGTSNVIVTKSGAGIGNAKANQRQLVTPDELRRASGQNIFAFFADKPVTYYPKRPYYEMPFPEDNSRKRFDDNPYFK